MPWPSGVGPERLAEALPFDYIVPVTHSACVDCAELDSGQPPAVRLPDPRPIGKVNARVHLSAIRKMWNTFYKASPPGSGVTKQDFLDFATQVDDQLGNWFTPRVR